MKKRGKRLNKWGGNDIYQEIKPNARGFKKRERMITVAKTVKIGDMCE